MGDHPGDMQVVGFGFREAWHAEAAETELRAMLDVGERDLSIAEIGGDAQSARGYAVVLGGRIREDRVPDATEVVGRHAGEVLTRVPEHWT